MTTFPLADCCAMLDIDPKTLRNWLKHAQMPLQVHPTDARIKCLTSEQVQQLAAVHAHPIELPKALAPFSLGEPSPLTALEMPTDTRLALAQTPPTQTEMNLLGKLSLLETQVSTMQQHLAQLALELLQERTLRYEQRLQTLETLIGPTQQPSAQPLVHQRMDEQNQPEDGRHKQRRLPPAKQQAPSRVIPLIEYAADGTYVVICPEFGELPLIPASPEWFDWLATLSSLRFVGQQGRLSAYRKKGRTFCWFAYRRIHHRRYEHALGRTDHLTIDCLEQMAAKLQSALISL
jgi:hypothetical protein